MNVHKIHLETKGIGERTDHVCVRERERERGIVGEEMQATTKQMQKCVASNLAICETGRVVVSYVCQTLRFFARAFKITVHSKTALVYSGIGYADMC